MIFRINPLRDFMPCIAVYIMAFFLLFSFAVFASVAAASPVGQNEIKADDSSQSLENMPGKKAEKTNAKTAGQTAHKRTSKKTYEVAAKGLAKGYKKIIHLPYSCMIPEAWAVSEKSADREKETGVYHKEFTLGSQGGKLASFIFADYYAPGNIEFENAEDFITVNSMNDADETESITDKYEPVRKQKIAGKNAFVIERKEKRLNADAWEKEKLYVIPASKGFYVLLYSADEKVFANSNLKEFEKMAASFIMKY